MKIKQATFAVLLISALPSIFAHEGHKHGGATPVPKSYPLKKCVVSDDPFDHGKPIKVSYKGTDVYLCCKSCKKDFDKDPAKYTAMVKQVK
jgi:YHS domain-containing protein